MDDDWARARTRTLPPSVIYKSKPSIHTLHRGAIVRGGVADAAGERRLAANGHGVAVLVGGETWTATADAVGVVGRASTHR